VLIKLELKEVKLEALKNTEKTSCPLPGWFGFPVGICWFGELCLHSSDHLQKVVLGKVEGGNIREYGRNSKMATRGRKQKVCFLK
jgi:hypothetical protein